MSRILAITNQKGGVGKTTTSVNLAASLAASGKRVIMIDMDAQGNATTGSGVDKDADTPGTYELLMGETTLADCCQRGEGVSYDVIASNSDLTAAEIALMQLPDRDQRLKKALVTAADKFDYVLIDCPPALNILTLNALVAANGVVIPMQCEYYALEGLTSLLNTIEQVRSSVNPHLEIEGLLRTMYDGRNNLGNQVSSQLSQHFGEKVYRTVIPRNVRLAEAPSYGLPALNYDKTSRGALAYLALAGEIIRRESQLAPSVATA